MKAAILRNLSRLPGGKSVYVGLQKLLGTTAPQPKRDLQRAIELIELVREAGEKIEGRRCYEIGTGWHPYSPLAFYLAGADEIETVDINPWMSHRAARSAVAAAEPHLEWFANELKLNLSDVKRRYEAIDLSADTLDALLASMNCRYLFPGDATATGHADNSFDIVFSSNVLEHIPPGVLADIARESLRILQPGGLAVHRFNPGDHYANDDPRLGTGHFLQFDDRQWSRYGDGLAYHNRLRCSEYAKLFREAGFLALIEETRVDQAALEDIRTGRQKLAEKYQAFEAEDLAADYMWLACMKGLLNPDEQRDSSSVETGQAADVTVN